MRKLYVNSSDEISFVLMNRLIECLDVMFVYDTYKSIRHTEFLYTAIHGNASIISKEPI